MPVEPRQAYTDKYSISDPNAKIKIYFLQASRSIRPVWLLEELSIPYSLDVNERIDYVKLAPRSFKDRAGSVMGKFPVVYDEGMQILESGAQVQLLCDKYDVKGRMISKADFGDARVTKERNEVVMWMHAAEGTIMTHCLAILYARWQFPAEVAKQFPDAVEEMVKKLTPNVANDLKWVERSLEENGGWLVGGRLTAADIMVEFSVSFLLERELGAKKGDYPGIDKWLDRCHEMESWKRAVAKSGHTLHPKDLKL
jgi:glutathione S-transferase